MLQRLYIFRPVRRVLGGSNTPPPLFGGQIFFLLVNCSCQRGWSRVWEIDSTSLRRKGVSESPPPPPPPATFFRTGAPSRPGMDCKTPPLKKKSCVRHCTSLSLCLNPWNLTGGLVVVVGGGGGSCPSHINFRHGIHLSCSEIMFNFCLYCGSYLLVCFVRRVAKIHTAPLVESKDLLLCACLSAM